MGRSRSKKKNNVASVAQPKLDLIDVSDISDVVADADTGEASDSDKVHTNEKKPDKANEVTDKKSSNKTVRSLQELKSITAGILPEEPEEENSTDVDGTNSEVKTDENIKSQPKKNENAESKSTTSHRMQMPVKIIKTDNQQISSVIRKKARENKRVSLNQLNEIAKILKAGGSNAGSKEEQNITVSQKESKTDWTEKQKRNRRRGNKLTFNKIKLPEDKRPSAALIDRVEVAKSETESTSGRLRAIDEVFDKCVEKPKFGLSMCIDNILQDYVNTEFDWLYKWLTTTGRQRLVSIIDLKSSISEIVYKDIVAKCLMDIITYIITKMYLGGMREIDAILNDCGMCFCILHMDEDVNVYQVEINKDILIEYGDNDDRLLELILNATIKIQNLYLTKKYALNIESIINGVDNLPRKDNLLYLSYEQVEQLPRVVDEKALFFRKVPKYFYDRFMQYKSIYRYLDSHKHSSCFINFVRRAASDINTGIRYLNNTLNDTDRALKLYYKGELELIYNFLFNKIIGKSVEYKRLLTEEVMRALFISGRTPKSVAEVHKLSANDEEKIIYLNCLLSLLNE